MYPTHRKRCEWSVTDIVRVVSPDSGLEPPIRKGIPALAGNEKP